MEKALGDVIDVFHQYSVRVGNPDTLTKRELRQLINKELPNFLKDQQCPAEVAKILEDLDSNQDFELSFEEFVVLITRLTVASHNKMHENAGSGPGHSHGPGLGESGHGHGHSHGPGHGHSHKH
ncbi:protein S100-A9 [Tachyglossus aculeatus]|uniref:protein S100-A9 n=1 Tax=Tachyglossus aculeatus TaxID=9261 RepID=UPI0018F7BBBB|nr:protein S100-A9 [Tachyglossus aculeatus]